MIARTQEQSIRQWLGKGKAIIVTGPRQVGKTTLVLQITKSLDRKTLWFTGDDPEARSLLDNVSLARLQNIIGQNEVVVVDEAQRFTNTGLTLKLYRLLQQCVLLAHYYPTGNRLHRRCRRPAARLRV